jgi:signal transduction histidine kinase
LERVGTQATATLLLLAAAVLLVLILALPRPGFRQLLHRVLRSYSKRLLILYTLLVLVPLPLLNLAFIAGVKERLWLQQKAAGEGALLAAQRYLLEDLENLPLGFSLDFTFAERLRELSSIIRHDVNLYYGSRESRIVSSRPELFAAGLLPKRVPGEVFSRLSLEGYNLTSRQREVEDTAYVELYAPLRVTTAGPVRFILSVPLLAQQEEVAEQLGHLRRHSILVTALLFAILVTVSARLAQGFAAPITQLVEGTRRIAAGASSLNLAPTEWELAELVQAVDDMAARIALGRRQLLREKHVVERIVEHITSGVVSLDRQRRVLMHNRVAAQMVGARTGVSLDELLAENPRLAPVRDFLARAGDEGPVQEAVKLSLGEGEDREWSLIWVPIAGTEEPASLLVVEDATEVLRGQRLEAWAEMARIIAHEIKNPLTPIRLSTEHLREVYRRDPVHLDTVFERCTSNILKQVEELRLIATEFSTYSSILHIDPHTGDLAAAVGELVESYQTAPPPGIRILYQPPAEGLEARFDDRLLGRAVRNLLENAVRASAGGGEVTVTVRREADSAVIRVTDRGSGVEPSLLAKIFDPYFSTYDSGTGLGLPISRRIVEEHGGTILARNREGGGLEVEITIPAQ